MLGAAVVALFGFPPCMISQQDASSPRLIATVTFTIDFPQSDPAHYSIAVDASGHAHYECTGRVVQDSEVQTYRSEFEVAAASREKIFAWTKQAQYFAGKIDSGNRKLAFTGTKILTYRDGERNNTEQYDYSNLAPVRQLTTLFQTMAATQEYGHRLAYYHRYQKLALDEELKHMEVQAKNNELSDLEGVAPVLQEILEDTSVMNVVRARAQELLQLGNGATAGR